MYCGPIFNQSMYNPKRTRTLACIKTRIKIFQFTNWKAFTTNVIIFIYWLPAWDTYKFVTIFMMRHAHCYCVVNGWLILNIYYIMTSKILKLESLLVCWLIVVLEALSHPSTCLGFPPLLQKIPSSFLCWSIFAVHTWQQQKNPHTCLLMSILPRWLDFTLFFSWLLQVCTCIGKDGTKRWVLCGIFGKKIYKIRWTHLIWSGSFWDLLVCFNPSCLYFFWLIVMCL